MISMKASLWYIFINRANCSMAAIPFHGSANSNVSLRTFSHLDTRKSITLMISEWRTKGKSKGNLEKRSPHSNEFPIFSSNIQIFQLNRVTFTPYPRKRKRKSEHINVLYFRYTHVPTSISPVLCMKVIIQMDGVC